MGRVKTRSLGFIKETALEQYNINIFSPIIITFAQNICNDDILAEFEYGTSLFWWCSFPYKWP
jgi:hypothetical protein